MQWRLFPLWASVVRACNECRVPAMITGVPCENLLHGENAVLTMYGIAVKPRCAHNCGAIEELYFTHRINFFQNAQWFQVGWRIGPKESKQLLKLLAVLMLHLLFLGKFHTSYLMDSCISFTLILEFQKKFGSKRSIRSSTYGKINVSDFPPCGKLVIFITEIVIFLKTSCCCCSDYIFWFVKLQR